VLVSVGIWVWRRLLPRICDQAMRTVPQQN
jgi:hypothetical protein